MSGKKKKKIIKDDGENLKDHALREIDVSKIDLKKLGLAVAKNPGLMEFAHSISSANIAPLKESQIRARSHQAMLEQIDIQKDQIYEQLRLLAKQVKNLHERRRVSEEVYQAKMTFEPVIGTTYYLYKKGEDKILSMVAPDEWGRSQNKLVFISKVKLLGDRTWHVDSPLNSNKDS